ncbi:hypothetical protein ACFQFC_29785 [Amorphoplanes digitatis]|uniref:Lipoprotein n=1 Tax=Actinoplanes digitatis TaxID=1868 RepID=A0A7W7MNH6_9ACTN|nr:hypothetical protein [Actinoplanes digitatis]MBB4760339.1 hypothetical protein [Actinoplanes digitatis]BFE68451.1 hypothetical protein GCM10020092_017520 [Actinoplanes digitatis]GID97477.1 hypothetical protein Adi01nite_68890 [Actinoplanes digitatis]
MRKTLLGAVVLVLALQGCSADDDSSAAPPSSGSHSLPPSAAAAPSGEASAGATGGPGAVGGPAGSPGPTASATSGLGEAPAPAGFLDGKRQVFFLPRLNETELPDSVLAVTGGGRLQVTDDYTDRALFVPVPKGGGAPERLIKTGALRAGGEPFCLQVRAAAGTLTVVTAACDAAEPAQLFTFEASGRDEEGRTTYAVRNRAAFLQWHPLGATGLVAEEIGDSALETTFTLQDQGAAKLPRA